MKSAQLITQCTYCNFQLQMVNGMILLSKTKKLTKNRVDQETPKKTKNSKMVSNLDVVSFSLKGFGSLYVSGKLPTYPSPKPIFCPKWEVSVNVELGKGLVVSFPETCCGWVQLSNDVLQKIEKILNPTTSPPHITYHRIVCETPRNTAAWFS